jgi:hypothetical protein
MIHEVPLYTAGVAMLQIASARLLCACKGHAPKKVQAFAHNFHKLECVRCKGAWLTQDTLHLNIPWDEECARQVKPIADQVPVQLEI